MADLYNAEGYVSPTEYAAFTRIEKAERAAEQTEFDFSVAHKRATFPHISPLVKGDPFRKVEYNEIYHLYC